MMTLTKLIPRLLARAVRQPNGCLVIPGNRRYIDVAYDGKRERAHRAIWERNCGPIPEGLEVCHACDNTRCIAIAHLFVGTHAANIADRDAKGRNGTLGEASPLAKLTREKVLAIDALLDRLPFDAIAEQFAISKQTVVRIANRTTWKHLFQPHATRPSRRDAELMNV